MRLCTYELYDIVDSMHYGHPEIAVMAMGVAAPAVF